MAYTAPTPAQLKAMYPAFEAVANSTVQLYLDRAGRSVDTSWTETDYADAIMLLACHLMVLAGLGTGAEAEAYAQGVNGFSLIRSGQLTLQRAATSRGNSSGVPELWSGTEYGSQFYWLLRRNKPGMAVAASSSQVGIAPNYPAVWNGWPLW